MSGRRVRNVLLLAIVGGIGYWIYTDRPTVSELVDKITGPLMGSHAAVKASERNRVEREAGTNVGEQTEQKIEFLRPGMSRDEVTDLMGRPDSVERVKKDGIERIRWTFREGRKVVVFQGNRVVSISVLDPAAAAP